MADGAKSMTAEQLRAFLARQGAQLTQSAPGIAVYRAANGGIIRVRALAGSYYVTTQGCSCD